VIGVDHALLQHADASCNGSHIVLDMRSVSLRR
jgi:hypothetical protein